MKNKKLLFVPLIAITLFSSACAKQGDKRLLKLEFVKAGFGLKPYENLAKAFMKEHPDVQVKLVANPNIAGETELKLSNKNNLSDIVMYNRSTADIYKWVRKGYIYDLSEVFEQEVENGQTLKDKLDANALEVGEYQGKYWIIPEYYNVTGFVYNATLFEAKGWEVPKTTTEFQSLCNKISGTTAAGKPISPLIYCGAAADGYLYFGNDGWQAVYEGVDNMKDFYKFDSPEVYAPQNQVGRCLGYDTVNKFFFENEDYCFPRSMELGHIEAQSKLLTYEAAMMLNGPWLENEMAPYMNSDSPKLKMFRIPEITDKSGKVVHAEGYTSNSQNQSVSAADFTSNMFIPKDANNIPDAVEFLKFMAREDILQMWTKDSNAPRPFNYDMSPTNPAYKDMSDFGKSILEIASTSCLYVANSKSDLALVGKAGLNPQGGYWFKKSYTNPTTYTGEYCVDSDYAYAKTHWNEWVEYARNNL